MPGGAGIQEEWLGALEDALGAFADLLLDTAVVAAWQKASCLNGYSVGGIAGHVLSLAEGLQARLQTDPPAVDVIPYQEWYAGAVLPKTEGTLHTRLIDVGEQLAARGPGHVRAQLAEVGKALRHLLQVAPADRAIPLASLPGAGVRLDDFVRTRFVEVLVHADDIAASAELACPKFSAAAWMLAGSVVAETSGVVGDGPQFVLRTCRPERPTRSGLEPA